MLSRLKTALWALLRRSRADRDLDEELRYHIEQQTDQNIRLGMSPEEARCAARKAFGGVEQAKERSRDARGARWLDELWQDLRYGARMLIKNPGFTFIAGLTLALGIGANTAIFSVVYGVLLRPLPYPESDRLVILGRSLSPANIAMYRDQNHVFEKFAAYNFTGFNLTGIDQPQRVQAANVTFDLFDLLRVHPLLGRTFRPEEDTPGRNLVCILSHGMWQRRFGGDPQILEKSLLLNGIPTQVVGVMPAWFGFPNPEVELWIPLGLNPQRQSPFFYRGIARLKPSVQTSEAQAETTNLLRNAARQDPKNVGVSIAPPEASLNVVVGSLKDHMVGDTKKPLLLLLVAVGLVLLIACGNVANLLLAQATSRTREVALRFVLGATPARIIRQLLTESLLLALIGATAGALLAWWGVGLLDRLPALARLPRIEEVGVNTAVLAFTAGVALLTGLLFGLAPGMRAYRLGLDAGMREGLRGSASNANRRMNSGLVAAQFAFSLFLLVGSGLLLKSFQRLLSVNPGFQPGNVMTMLMNLPGHKYADATQLIQFYESLIERVRSLPGVQSAAIVSHLPMSGEVWDSYRLDGHEMQPGETVPNAEIRLVSPGYFPTLRIPLLRGRDFLDSDREASPLVAIVDETLARRHWPDGDAVGKRIRFDSSNNWMMIVGVAGAVKEGNLAEPMHPHLYLAYAQKQWPFMRGMYLTVRTATESTAISAAMRNEIRRIDPDLPVWSIRTMTTVIDNTLSRQRLINLLLTVFALVAVMLAAIGVYGVMSVYVSNRTTEFGIRMALGAQPDNLLRTVLRQGLQLVVAGIALGIAGALALTRTMASLLFEVSVTDPVVFTGVSLLLLAVALLACWLPARRATKVDPLAALRSE
jgi:putative ABC transport system permease protein